MQKTLSPEEKKVNLEWGSNPGPLTLQTFASTTILLSPNCSDVVVSILHMSLIDKAFIRRIKKPVLNTTLTLTLVLRAKHDIFHCLYEGKFFVSLRRSRVGRYARLQLVCLIVELLMSYWDEFPQW